MKVLRSTATPSKVTPAPLFGFDISQSTNTLGTEAAPSLIPEATRRREQPDKSLKTKGVEKEMLKMKEPPDNLFKTQGQIGTSQEVNENK